MPKHPENSVPALFTSGKTRILNAYAQNMRDVNAFYLKADYLNCSQALPGLLFKIKDSSSCNDFRRPENRYLQKRESARVFAAP